MNRQQLRALLDDVRGGMSLEDTATALGVSPRTAQRDWIFARAWLRREMQLRLDELG